MHHCFMITSTELFNVTRTLEEALGDEPVDDELDVVAVGLLGSSATNCTRPSRMLVIVKSTSLVSAEFKIKTKVSFSKTSLTLFH